jgi:hypothetical protein
MMKMPRKISLIALVVVLLISCVKDEDNQAIVATEILEYFSSFQEEAALRDVPVDLEEMRINGVLQDIEGSTILGQCNTSGNGEKTVIIDAFSWSRLTDLQKEFLVFHELGHCALGRTHDDSSSPNGTCISIMNTGESNCNIRYNSQNRSTYLDELFSN